MKSLISFLCTCFFILVSSAQAKSFFQLTDVDSSYLADMEMLTTTGKGYFVQALPDHSENWQEVMKLCSVFVKREKFSFPIIVTIRPSGSVVDVVLDISNLQNRDKLSKFTNCVGENLLRGGYPAHPFKAYYLKFNATNLPANEMVEIPVNKKIERSDLVGIWKSEQNGSYIKIDKLGRTYYCLYKNNDIDIKIIAMGEIDENNNFIWGKFFMLRKSEIFNLKEDLNKDMGKTWTQTIESGVLKIQNNGAFEGTYLKSSEMDIMCD